MTCSSYQVGRKPANHSQKMTATAHALIGASLAAKIANPYLGLPVALISHFVADMIPHWDAGTNHRKKTVRRLQVEAVIDVLLGLTLVLIIFKSQITQNPIYFASMVLTAQLPDWIAAPAVMFNFNIPPFSWMKTVSHKSQTRMQLPWGLVTQVVIVGLLIFYALGGPQNIGVVLAANF